MDGTRPDRPSPRAVPPSFGPRTRCRVGRCSIRDRRRFSLQTCSLSSSSLLDEGHAAGRAPGVQDLCVARLDDLHRLSRAHTHRGRGRACERAGAERGSSRRKRVSGAWREGLAEGACACACAATHILGGRLGGSLLAHGLLEHLELRLGHGRSCACIARAASARTHARAGTGSRPRRRAHARAHPHYARPGLCPAAAGCGRCARAGPGRASPCPRPRPTRDVVRRRSLSPWAHHAASSPRGVARLHGAQACAHLSFTAARIRAPPRVTHRRRRS